MKLSEVLMGLEMVALRALLRRYAIEVHGYPTMTGRGRSHEVPQGFDDFQEAFNSRRNDKEFIINCIEQRLDTYNNTQAELILQKSRRPSIPIWSHQHSKMALLVSLLPEKTVEQTLVDLAIEADTPLPNISDRWECVAQLAAIFSSDIAYPSIELSSPCPNCQKSNPTEANHCIHCGTNLSGTACAKCETMSPPQARFCMQCGEEK